MQFIKDSDAVSGGNKLRDRIIAELQSDKLVLWLLTGGSGIPLCSRIMSEIPGELTPRLTVALADERYGPVGHPDSNWRQLDDFGFDAKQATRLEVLGNYEGLAQAATQYDRVMEDELSRNDVVIGTFGMGPDGHTVGVLPHTIGVTSQETVVGYETPQYDRITMTLAAVSTCDAAFLFAYGDGKREVLQKLQQEVPLDDQPAQILKRISESYVYNDQIGDQS